MPKINDACKLLRTVFDETPLQYSKPLSMRYGARIFLKREDLTPVRSYKIRGAFNKTASLLENKHGNDRPLSVVTCSAGNHAQGVAFSCDWFKLRGDIFMPKITTQQKIRRVQQIGSQYVRIFLEGDTFDECYAYSMEHVKATGLPFIHPFDDEKVIEGQATVGQEIAEQMTEPVDAILLPIGGGGLAAGVSSYFRECSPSTEIIGTGPLGAPAMHDSLLARSIVTLDSIQTFVDGASVKRVGSLNFPIVQSNVSRMFQIDEGHVCTKMLQMYNEYGLILEPAGVLALCGLDHMSHDELQGRTIVVILSGGNSDIYRMPEIFERSLMYEGRKHYFRIQFPQRAGALKDFIVNVLESGDDIIYFRYTKRLNQEKGPVILGIETQMSVGTRLSDAMEKKGIRYEVLNGQADL